MKMIKSCYVVIYVILLCTLANGGSEGKKWDLHEFINEHCHLSSSFHEDGKQLEQAWKHCRKELVEKKHGNQKFDLRPTKAAERSERQLLHDSSNDQILPTTFSHSASPSPSHGPTSLDSPSPPSHKEYPKLTPLLITAFLHSPPPPPPPPKRDNNKSNQLLKLAFIASVTVCVISALVLICLCRGIKTKKIDQNNEGTTIALAPGYIFNGQPKSTVLEKHCNEFTCSNERLVQNSEDVSLITTETASLSAAQMAIQHKSAPPPSPPPPPPPPPAPRAPPPPPPKAKKVPPPVPRKPIQGKNKQGKSDGGESNAPKAKLKPFFWDKVNQADQGMVWQQVNQGSFQFNEEMIESLFGYANNNQRNKETSLEPAIQYIQIIDRRKAQNLSILLRALNVTTEEIIDALNEGSEVPVEIIQPLLRMTLTADEELKLRSFSGNLDQLGPAQRFLKALIDIPFAFQRLESLMFIYTFTEEVSNLKDSLTTLEIACNNLRKNKLFLKLLEAVLKTGNRMNDGTYRGGAQAFKLDTLLKLSDVKGTDGKTTLLHFVVQEIIRSEGIRAVRSHKSNQPSSSNENTDETFMDDADEESTAEHYRRLGLQVVSGLGDELADVKKAAIADGEGITVTVSKLGHSLLKAREFLNNEMKSLDEDSGFSRGLESFVEKAESEITWLHEEENRIMCLVRSTADYFHGTAGKDEGLRLFTVVRDFLIMLDKACREVQDTNMKLLKASKKESPTESSVPETRPPADIHRRLFPAIAGRRVCFSDSDDESSSLSP